MSDERAEKRFDATPARRERAKRDGNTARSHEIAGIAGFIGGLTGLGVGFPLLASAAAVALRDGARDSRGVGAMPAIIVLGLALVPAVCAAVAGTAVALAQSGGLRVNAVKVAFGKLAPLPGLKRMFGPEAAVGAGRALVAFAAIVAVLAPVGMRTLAAAAGAASPEAAAGIAWSGMLQAGFAAAGVGTLFALGDYALARRRWLQSLKMTFDEFKRDAKEQDGDPHAKSRRKQLHRTLIRGGIVRTREASFLIVNPTHIAIALRYAPPAVAVPEILVRAADALALEVRSIAERERIPVIEDIALARLLWRSGAAGRAIPAESFVAVATAIAALMRAGVLAR